jgi:hypothetical protein
MVPSEVIQLHLVHACVREQRVGCITGSMYMVYAYVCVSSGKSRMAYTVVFKGFDS